MYKQHRHKSALKLFSVFFVVGQSWGTKIHQTKKKIGKHNSTRGAVLWAQNKKVRRKKKILKAESQRKKNCQRKKKWESKNLQAIQRNSRSKKRGKVQDFKVFKKKKAKIYKQQRNSGFESVFFFFFLPTFVGHSWGPKNHQYRGSALKVGNMGLDKKRITQKS
jgi:hypothetical protein